MKKIIAICFISVFAFADLAEAATWPAAGSWNFPELPAEFGAVNTYALGIDGQNIVGYYNDGTQDNDQGFFYNGTTWSSVKVDGAICTYVLGVNGTSCVGYYLDSSYASHGFLKDGENLITLDVTGGINTYISNISGNKMVGGYEDDEGTGQGFIYDRISGEYTFLIKEGATSLNPNSIDGNNIIGEYYDGEHSHNFFYDGVSWNTNPDALLIGNATSLFDIDGSNILGNYTSDSGQQSFIHDGANSYDLPDVNISGATSTSFSGLSGDDISGWYTDSSGNDHMFIYNTITVPEPLMLVLLVTAVITVIFFSFRKKQ